jgi:hypothetical protein
MFLYKLVNSGRRDGSLAFETDISEAFAFSYGLKQNYIPSKFNHLDIFSETKSGMSIFRRRLQKNELIFILFTVPIYANRPVVDILFTIS